MSDPKLKAPFGVVPEEAETPLSAGAKPLPQLLPAGSEGSRRDKSD